jgi:hypothetical protein
MHTRISELGGLDQSFLDTVSQGIQKFADTAQSVSQNPLKAAVKSVAFYSAYSEPITYTADELMAAYKAPKGPPGLMDRIKPTIVIDSPLVGRKVIAPYGEATPDEWKGNVRKAILIMVGGLALYFIGGYYLGYKAGQRSKR